MVKSSSRTLDRSSPVVPTLPLLVGLESAVEATKLGRELRLAGLADGLAAWPGVFARFLATLDEGTECFVPVPLGGLFPGVLSAGVSGRSGRFEAYGSAVCGLAISGRRGRLTGPDMSDAPFFAAAEPGVAVAAELDDTTLASGRDEE